MLNPYSLYLVTDSSLIGDKGLEEVVQAAVSHGVTAVQIREKNMPAREFVDLGRSAKSVLDGTSIPLIINDRIDVALAIGADGVHIGQGDIGYRDARDMLGAQKIIGLTVETMAEAEAAGHLDVDYLGLSSVFPTPTKKDATASWSEGDIAKLKEASPHLLVGIGGINQSNLGRVLTWGLDGVAVVSAICAAANIDAVVEQTRKLRALVEAHDDTG